MSKNEFMNELIKFLIVVGTPYLGVLLTSLYAKLHDWITLHIQNQWVQRISNEALEVVAAVGQSVADPIKEAAKDGKFSDEEKQKIKSIAMETLKKRLLGIPKDMFPELEKRLSDAIEAAVKRIKTDSSISSNPQLSANSK